MICSGGHGEFIPVCVFALSSVYGRALGFHVMTETGAQLARIPIHALVHRKDAPEIPLHHLQLWDCLSYTATATIFDYIKGARCQVILRDKNVCPGTYMFTVDWYGNNISEDPGDGGHKNAHIIQLDNGLYAAQPNNRILWREPSFITKPMDLSKGQKPDYLTNSHVWKCEIDQKWCAEDSQKLFYDDKEI